MNLEAFRQFCMSMKGVTESFPFGEDVLVYKVISKIFALTSFDRPLRVNLKCSPEDAVELRERFEDVKPGYHMNKKHWNTVNFEGKISDFELKKMIVDSYQLVVSGLSKKQRELVT